MFYSTSVLYKHSPAELDHSENVLLPYIALLSSDFTAKIKSLSLETEFLPADLIA